MIRKLETIAAAIGMAEEGGRDAALEMLRELGQGLPAGRRRIITVARDSRFMPESMEYAFGLASRMHCDTLFLNIFSPKAASGSEVGSQRAAFDGAFQTLARKFWPGSVPDVSHRHAVLVGDFGTMVRQACRSVAGVALVIVQKRRAEPCVLNLHVPVFCFDMGPAQASGGPTPRSGAAPRKRERKS